MVDHQSVVEPCVRAMIRSATCASMHSLQLANPGSYQSSLLRSPSSQCFACTHSLPHGCCLPSRKENTHCFSSRPKMEPEGTINSAESEPIFPSSQVITNQSAGSPDFGFHTEDHIVTFNVGGRIFKTQQSTLSHHSETLLGNPVRLETFRIPNTTREYFFDRNASAFESVLEYFRNGSLVKPEPIPVQVFVRDLLFYDLGLDVVKHFLVTEELFEHPVPLPDPQSKVQLFLYDLFNVPGSSIAATILSILDILMVFLAIIALCVQSMPTFKTVLAEIPNVGNVTTNDNTTWADPFLEIEIATNVWFISELIIRFSVDPAKMYFFLRFMSAVDVLSIVPFFVDVLPYLVVRSRTNHASFLLAFRVLRIFRIFKALRLRGSLNGLAILAETFANAKRAVATLILFFVTGMLFFGAAIYYAEQDNPNTDYHSVPEAFWWAVVTWTTIGYGDMVPKTPAGKTVACFAAVSGIIVVGLAIPPVVERYHHFFTRAHKMEELKPVYQEYKIFQFDDKVAQSREPEHFRKLGLCWV